MKFYFDNYHQIVHEATFQGPATLMFDDICYHIYFHDGKAMMPEKVQLRKRYTVIINDEQYPVIYRFIVTTKEFEETCYYDGVLGPVYTKTHTDFYIWAPCAYALRVHLVDAQISYEATANEQGVYHVRIDDDLDGVGYILEVEHEKVKKCLDPYAISSSINSKFNYVIDKNRLPKVTPLPREYTKNEAILYEMHVRDFSMDEHIAFEHRGKFQALTQPNVKNSKNDCVGFDYIKELGVTHIQLMPIYDFGSIREEPQAREYNWGYDPVQYQVIEGKYASNPNDPYQRITELIDVISAYHKEHIAVNMDVVYNHAFHDVPFSYDVLVPYYFFRYVEDKKSDASYCGNEIASQHKMVRKFIIDTLVYLTKTFDFSGYRFDLMGIHDIQTMLDIQEKLSSIKPNILLYGEGWKLPTAIPHNECAIQENHSSLPQLGFFNDTFRNTIKSIVAGHTIYNPQQIISQLLLAQHYTHSKQSIQYVSCHDDYTLYDHLYYDFQCDDVLNRMKLAYIFVFLSKGIPFLHAGCEWGRTKLGIKNSYKSSDAINRLDWELRSENKELQQFVCELIKFRKQYMCNEDVSSFTGQVEYKDGMIEYVISKSIKAYINLTSDTKFLVKKNIMLNDGNVDGEIKKYSLIITQEETA